MKVKLDGICSLVKAKLNGIQIEFNVSVKRLRGYKSNMRHAAGSV